MGRFLLLLLLFSTTVALAQHAGTGDAPVVLDQLPSEGVMLDKGWKFQSGNNPTWSQQNSVDLNWKTINLDQPPVQFMKATDGGFGWLRLHFLVDSTLWQTPISLLITQYGASELYLDGKLISRFGSIAPEKTISFNPHNEPIPLHLEHQQQHLLAIHFSAIVPKASWLQKEIHVTPLSVRLQPTTQTIKELQIKAKEQMLEFVYIAITGVFGVLFLLIFLFFPRQPLNLYFSLFNIGIALTSCLQLFLAEGQYGFDILAMSPLLNNFIGRGIGSSVMAFIALALYGRIPPFFKWLIGYVLSIDFILTTLLPVQFAVIGHLTHAVFMFAFLWLSMRAFRKFNLKNWLIGLMALFSFSVNLDFYLHLFWNIDPLFGPIFFFGELPVMILYLALNYAQINTSLERQLIQVSNLSEKNLKQEQEKQQILASQKEMLEQQVKERTAALNQSLNELNATQDQLVQREKMASLGELTAGIAHEIQNPLNFVNNFSETNAELLTEMNQELDTGDFQEAKLIAQDVIENERKISHHGKRAQAIVTGMLQHSRTSTGDKEPIDLNALADEYLRLSYHGMRVKDKAFEVQLQSDFDTSIGMVRVVPQDLGRVLLNLFNNAFYATLEKKKQLDGSYEPVVRISTIRMNDRVEIQITDNGTGIPKAALQKIFQPFFTTKPTGEGTGLGLSLSYDIIKAHGGELLVESEEGQSTTFMVRLPT